MAAHSRNLAWKNPTDRGAWQATVRGAARVRHDLATKPSQGSVQSWACPSVYSMLINSALVSMRAQVQSSRNDFLSNSWVFAAQHGNWESWTVDMCLWETLLDPILFYFIIFRPAAWLAGSEFVNQALNPCPLRRKPRVSTTGAPRKLHPLGAIECLYRLLLSLPWIQVIQTSTHSTYKPIKKNPSLSLSTCIVWNLEKLE